MSDPEGAPNFGIVTVVWDKGDDTLSVDHEGLNGFEAVGMLVQALEMVRHCEEVDDDA